VVEFPADRAPARASPLGLTRVSNAASIELIASATSDRLQRAADDRHRNQQEPAAIADPTRSGYDAVPDLAISSSGAKVRQAKPQGSPISQ